MDDITLKNAYSGLLSISQSKLADLLKLCDELAIPQRYHSYYQQLTETDELPSDVDVEESDSEQESESDDSEFE